MSRIDAADLDARFTVRGPLVRCPTCAREMGAGSMVLHLTGAVHGYAKGEAAAIVGEAIEDARVREVQATIARVRGTS